MTFANKQNVKTIDKLVVNLFFFSCVSFCCHGLQVMGIDRFYGARMGSVRGQMKVTGVIVVTVVVLGAQR